MERQSLLILLLLGCHAILLVSSQPTGVVVNNGQQQEQQPQQPQQPEQSQQPQQPQQPQQEQQQQQGESIPSSGGDSSSGSEEVGGSGVEIPVMESSTEEGGHSMTGCQALCDESCENAPEECEFIDEAVPVMCGNDVEECKAGCEKFCACEFACGCNVAEGCDDPCSLECQTNFKPILPAEVSSTPEGAAAAAPGEVKNDKGATGLPVVYKKVDEEEMED